MPRGGFEPDEETAGKIIAQQLGGTPLARDVPGAGEGVHDLDIKMPDGQRVPVEVTSVADGAIEALRKLALGREWPAPSLGHHWWLGVPNDGSVQVKALMTKVVPHLEVLEQNDIEQVGGVARGARRAPDGAGQDVADATRMVFELGADRATRLRTPKPGETALVMASVHGGISSDFDLLNAAVAECAAAKAAKLAAAEGSERHLFVWIRPSAPGVELAMATLPPPEETPTMPEGLDVVWVATGPTTPGALFGQLWRLRPPGGWEMLG